jgi:hypothetical protein
LSHQEETKARDCTFKSVTQCPSVEACNVHVGITSQVNLNEASCDLHKPLEDALSENDKSNSCQLNETINTISSPCDMSQENTLFEVHKQISTS